ncbi:MAG: sulfotransferase family protein, partial [Planctomycetota bacterium]
KDTLSFVEVYEKLLPRPHGDQIAWGEKSLNNLFFVRDLIKMYPDSVIIHIIRDARSSLLSYFQKKQRDKSGKITKIARKLQSNWSKSIIFFAKQAILWKHWMSIARSSKQLIPPETWTEIRFEDLLEKPEDCLRSLCDKIGVAFEDKMLDPASRLSDPVLETEAAYAHQKIAQDLDKSRAHSYEILSPHLIWVVEKHAGEMMQELGYHLIRPNLPFWQRYTLITTLTRYRWIVKREVVSHMNLRCL